MPQVASTDYPTSIDTLDAVDGKNVIDFPSMTLRSNYVLGPIMRDILQEIVGRSDLQANDDRKNEESPLSDLPGDCIAIVGMAARLPGANSIEEFWKNLCAGRSEEHTSELQSPCNLVCRLLL